jgi:hypothetical protein
LFKVQSKKCIFKINIGRYIYGVGILRVVLFSIIPPHIIPPHKARKDTEKEMSEKREISDGRESVKGNSKRQKTIENEEESCIVCMRTEEELVTADCPIREEHGCPRCTKTSW